MKNGFNKIKDFCTRNKAAVIAVALGFAVVIVVIVLTVVLLPDRLTRIEIETPPAKTHYIEKQALNADGLTVKAFYGKKSVSVTDYVLDKSVLELGDTCVTVSFTDGGVTRSAAFDVTVSPKSIIGLEIASEPQTTDYYEGALFDTTGLAVRAVYDNGERAIVSDWDHDVKRPLDVSDTVVNILYGGRSVSVSITVHAKRLRAISATRLPFKTKYVEGEYFDFLGLEITASYENGNTEVVKAWDYDKKAPLAVSDDRVGISYTHNGVTRSTFVAINVGAAEVKPPEQERADSIIAALPPVSELTAENISSIDYVLSVLGELSELTPEQSQLKEELEAKKQELDRNVPPIAEKVYSVTYSVSNGLDFPDADLGGNPVEYKESDGRIELKAASSEIAVEQGYVFKGWVIDGALVSALENLTADTVVYALFELTPTVDLVFKDYYTDGVLSTLTNILRTDDYGFAAANVSSVIYAQNGILPVAYYSEHGERIYSADLGRNKTVTVYVVTAEARELHLSHADSASVGWTYGFVVDGVEQKTAEAPGTGTVFVAPIGAEVTIASMHANIDDILVDGVSKGSKLNNSVVQAVFELTSGEYAASVTFKTVLSDMTTLSFVGYNRHSVVYPAGWDGYIASVDLETVAFVFDEANENYLVSYTIDGSVYYFDELAGYMFVGDTRISVDRVKNSFAFMLEYKNGTEKFEGLIGKRTVREALSGLDISALETLNAALDDGRLYLDEQRTTPASKADVLDIVLRGNVTVYSDWELPAPVPPEPPVFDEVDYADRDFAGEWSATFMYDGDLLRVELVLSADGKYDYASYVNGGVSAACAGVYRIEDGRVAIKTIEGADDLSLDDIAVNVEFSSDGLLVASFIDLRGNIKTVFDCTLTCGAVRPANYSDGLFAGEYEFDGVVLELRENGTAVVTYEQTQTTVYYRVVGDGLFIFDNGAFGTGIIEGFFGG